MFRRIMIIIAALALTACTPDQLRAIELFHAIDFSDEEEANLLALPDFDYVQGRVTIYADGSLVERPCEEPAAPEAHFYGDLGPALLTFRAVACERGWPQSVIDDERVVNFLIFDVVAKESMGCFNITRGSIHSAGTPCSAGGLTRYSDAGYGQVIGSNYSPSSHLCRVEGICSKQDVTATPRSSMTALLVMVELNGKQPWCWSPWARSYHRGCNAMPTRIWPW